MDDSSLEKIKEECSYRKCGYEGIEELLWVTTDTGAFGNTNDGPLFDWIKEHEIWMKKVQKFDTIVQAGGNCGMYPIFYKNYFKKVYTFEPDPRNFYCLKENCKNIPDIFHYEVGLGDRNCKKSIKNDNNKNVGTHKILDKPGKIRIITLDSLALQSCDLIHFDIEGYESKALEGSIKTIKRFNPIVILERSNGKEILERMGYKQWKRLRMDTIFIPKNILV